MPIHPIPTGRRIWQEVAEAYRPQNNPLAAYAQDERIGVYHAGTLAINFQLGVNTLPMHNAWQTGDWFGPYPLRVPKQERIEDFPRMVTPQQAAATIGYDIMPSDSFGQTPTPSIEVDVPAWVLAYRGWLLNQIDYYGYIVRRETRREF